MSDENAGIDQVAEAPQQSIQDRIASKFGFNGIQSAEADKPAAETQNAEPDLAEIEWEGLKFKAPPKVKEALMKNEDYTRKTQELAEQRKAYDQAREIAQAARLESAFSDSVKDEVKELGIIEEFLKHTAKLEWSSMTTEQILRQKLEIDGVKERKAQLQESVNEKRQKFQDDLKAKMAEMRKQSREIAARKIGEFSEETEKAVRSHALSKGLTEAEIENVLLDPRSAEIIWEAAQFAKIKAGTATASEKASKAAPTLKPGAAGEKMPQETRDKLAFYKAQKGAKTSGEKARNIEAYLQGKFG